MAVVWEKVARFESAGDVREMSVAAPEGGGAAVRESIWGPSVEAAYGERSVQIVVEAPGADAQALREFCARPENDVMDLMDWWDREGAAYGYRFLDANGGALRPMGE